MSEKLRPRLTYANVVSTLCLFILLGGGAYAATQLPANSVGTAQLKANAVTSPKIKNGTIVGADVNKAKLGKVPLAANADKAASAATATNAANASNAAKLEGLASSDFLRSNGKAVDATHADSASDASTLGGKSPADFVGAAEQAGGSLSGPFSNLAIRPNTITSTNVANGSLSQLDLSDFAHTEGVAQDTTADGIAATRPLGVVNGFGFTGECNNAGSGATSGTIVVTNGNGAYDMDASATSGEKDQVDVPGATPKRLVQVGPAIAHHFVSGSWSVRRLGGELSGMASVETNDTVNGANTCQFSLTRFGNGF